MNQPTYHVPNVYAKLREGRPLSDTGSAVLRVSVPGSKSITNRALLLATLANGRSLLKNVLFSDDSRHFLKCIQSLGFETDVDEQHKTIQVMGHGGSVPKTEASLYVGSAGTAARFLTAYLGVSKGTYHMDASDQMRRRPMAPLLDSLKALGCEVLYSSGKASDAPCPEGYFPFTLQGHGFLQDHISIDINHSSQFLSALLIASCLSEQDFSIHVEGSHGMAYIEMTRKMMEAFGVKASRTSDDTFLTKAGQSYHAKEYLVEPDVSAACYFYAMAPLLQVPVLVEHVHFASLQGDVAFLRVLERMGCLAADTPEGILLTPPLSGIFHGVEADLSACSDQAITLAAIAPFASSPTKITGIGHIRFQECNRLEAIVTELEKMGIRCEKTQDTITIYPGAPLPCTVNTYDDHRMAMGFSLTGLRSDGIIIDNPGCCRKTFENYFEVLEKILYTFFRI